ncbi:MAG: threonine synthase [Anaerolineae bacterium]|nr:threonine synthase [Anaerolineae bacterium]
MSYVLGLRCVLCGAEYAPDAVTYVCPKHGHEGILDVVYDYGAIAKRLTRQTLANRREPSIWRYLELLPIEDPALASPLQVGWTPLYRAGRLGQRLGLTNLWVKDDGRNPTASFKDRASAVGVVKARELGRETVTAASTGNAASSLAGQAASVGLSTVIFVPESAPQAKVAQLLLFGATVFMIRGSYDQAFDLCLHASERYGWYSRNTAYNPYLSEGKKTAALEVCEQLGWQPPDRIYVGVGDGCIIGGLAKGLRDLVALGLIDRLPRLVGVQAEGSAVLARAWAKGTEEIEPVEPQTLADSISVGIPRDRRKALRGVRETGGAFVTVSDEEILEAMRLLAREAGVFAEPAGAAPLAGLCRSLREGTVDASERIVVIVTGNGLKDVQSALRAAGQPHRIEPTARDLEAAVSRLGLA